MTIKKGSIVRVEMTNVEPSDKNYWAMRYDTLIGVVESRCYLYENSWSVRFPDGDDTTLASFKPQWLEMVKK